MGNFIPISAAIGGALIGLSAVLLMVFTGRIAGISGIFAGLINPQRLTVPGASFIVGLLVGFGTRLGSGCTSGHGICGIARLSPRSLVATGVFMLAAIVVVALTHHVFTG
jgi:uncharacterized membrane protein YedE/YeeE